MMHPNSSDCEYRILRRAVTGLLCLWLCVLMHISFFNIGGGDGVNLPQNMLAWSVAVVVIALTAGLMPCRRLHMTTTAWLLLGGVILLTLPVLWCPETDWIWLALPRLVGLWGAVVFYMALLQCGQTERQKKTLLWSLSFAALYQTANVWAGLFCPTLLSNTAQRFIAINGRMALGIFQQVNVTASFLATGFAVFTGLFVAEGIMPSATNAGGKRYLQWLKFGWLLAGLFFIPGTLVLMKSRIGLLGAGGVYLIAVISTLRQPDIQRLRVSQMALFPLAGGLVGVYLLDGSVMQAMEHSGSNHQRWLTLKMTWEMIRLHPWQGWGMGSFRIQFQHYMASHFQVNPSRELMGHPHNEVLYVWTEGGVVAVAGIALLAWAGMRLLVLNVTYLRLMTGMALVPMALHTQVEFPLYYSVAHALILLIIMATMDVPAFDFHQQKETTSACNRLQTSVVVRGIVVVGCSWMLFNLVVSMRTGFVLSRYEEQSLPDISVIKRLNVPWLLHSREEYDLLTEEMQEYSIRGDKKLLIHFLHNNAVWLNTHLEPDSYANQMDVLRYMHREEDVCRYEVEAHQLFPWDKRFAGQCLPRDTGN